MALTQTPTNLPHCDRKDWDENSGMGGSFFVGELGQMAVGVDIERAQLDHRLAAPLEQLTRIEVRVCDGISQISDEMRWKITHACSPLR